MFRQLFLGVTGAMLCIGVVSALPVARSILVAGGVLQVGAAALFAVLIAELLVWKP